MKKEPKPKKNAMGSMAKGKNAKMPDLMGGVGGGGKGAKGKMPKYSGKMGKW